jgi:phenylalanine ammonia-lyase
VRFCCCLNNVLCLLIFRNGKPFFVDGSTLSIAAVAAAARHNAIVELDASLKIKERVFRSRNVITDKVAKGTSVYGLSTGFGGSGERILPLR